MFKKFKNDSKNDQQNISHSGKRRKPEHRFLLIGSPNVGKSTFFNRITTATADVSNIDRLTVSAKTGKFKKDRDNVLVDLPGIYNLSHPIDEEVEASKMIISENYQSIVNIIGSQSIQRDLFLTLQTIETGLMNTLVINMIDEVNIKKLDLKKLSQKLNNISIVLTQTNKSIGIKEAKETIKNAPLVNSNVVKYSQTIENLIQEISKLLPESKISKRFFALMFLENNQYIINHFKKEYPSVYFEVADILKGYSSTDLFNEIKQTKITFVNTILKSCLLSSKDFFKKLKHKSRKIDRWLLNKWVGIPLFIILVVLIYYISFGSYMGGGLKDLWGETFLNGLVADTWIRGWMSNVQPFWQSFVIDGMIKGVFAVLAFIPTIIILFTLINLINQVGIISRVSVLLDRSLERFGLSGRSIVNLLTGFGCNVPAIMMARSSSSKKERVISWLIVPLIACSARILVISFICNLIFGSSVWFATMMFTFLSGVIALVMGCFFSKTMFRKQKSFFLVEMVDWRKPDFKILAKSVWTQLKEFIVKAGTTILIASIIIFLLVRISPTIGIINNINDVNKSFLGYISQGLNYIFYPCGFRGPDSWKMTGIFISAFPAKEIALSNINILFGSEQAFSQFITHNIPMGLSYCVLLIFALPCMAVVAILKKEAGWKILGWQLLSSTIVAYVIAIIVYWSSFGIVSAIG